MTIRDSKKRGEHLKSKAHARAPKQELEMAHRLSGRNTSASGAMVEKGDVRVEGVLRLESKSTTKASFTVTREMVDKIEQAAVNSGEVPAIDIEFLNESGKVMQHVALVPVWVLDVLVRERKDGGVA